ncbi:YrhC family protein [Halobacillus halophilus]|uniref:YrhC family protein n=1 Tax=Halobacillus halophilus TaxID=1570 RepID=UPI001CD7D944|nr:YrhC family protein [Halobacillus halophilus]MCA1009762.1 YrhC family protein [Halobacillus halophilus]
MKSTEWMEKKISDYKRFIMTLLILISYLYIGTLISIFEYHTTIHYFLYPVIGAGLIYAFLLIKKVKKMQQILTSE